MKKRFKLDTNEDIDFTVLAINSHIKGYKLCWNINKRLHVNFEKKKDHNIQDNLWFSRYVYICEEGVEYNLLANRSKKGYLIPTQKSINYFLIIKNDHKNNNKQCLMKNLSATKDVLLVFELETSLIKDIDRFVLK